MDSGILVIIINIHTVNGYWQKVQIAMKIYSMSVTYKHIILERTHIQIIGFVQDEIWDHFSTL